MQFHISLLENVGVRFFVVDWGYILGATMKLSYNIILSENAVHRLS